jgi:hypothetical protein
MVHVVIAGIIAGNELQRIEWEGIATVIVDRLKRRTREEEHCLPKIKADHFECDCSAQGVQHETLEGMIVQRTISVRDVQPVVAGVESC